MPNPFSYITALNDRVLVRKWKKKVGENDLEMPDIAIEGWEYHVVGVGPKVENIKIGDKVLVTGQQNVDWAFLPGSNQLFITNQQNVLVIVGHTDQYDG